MKSLTQYEAILFDFDGLLVNTENLHFKAYQKMIEQNGHTLHASFETFASIAHTSSTGLRHWIEKEFQINKPWEELYKQKSEIYQSLLSADELQLMPGAAEFLEKVAKSPIKKLVATNSKKVQIDQVRKAIPALSVIENWITREDYSLPKPAPDAYLKALEVAQVPPSKAIGFEDSLRGVMSLIHAGVDPILICSEKHPQMQDALAKSTPNFATFTEYDAKETVMTSN